MQNIKVLEGGSQWHLLLLGLFPRAEIGIYPVYSWVDKTGFRTVISRSRAEMRICFSVYIGVCSFEVCHQVCE